MSTVCSFHNKITFKVYLWARDLLWKEKEHIQNVTLEIHLHLTTTLTLGQKELFVAVRWLFQGDMDNNTPVFFLVRTVLARKIAFCNIQTNVDWLFSRLKIFQIIHFLVFLAVTISMTWNKVIISNMVLQSCKLRTNLMMKYLEKYI